jgi:hypothetical protein
MKTFNFRFKNLRSSNILLTKFTSKFNFNIKDSASILKNKDQTSENDKSYSGTDTKHTFGSDRVLEEPKKKGLTTNVDDSTVHQHIKTPYMNTTIPNQELKTSSDNENKTRSTKEMNRQRDEQESSRKSDIQSDTRYEAPYKQE